MKKVLLHICCGVCAMCAMEKLQEDGFYVEGFFFNPNIYPRREYDMRLEAALSAANALSVKVISGEYTQDAWLKYVEPCKDEPEGGRRCLLCYRFRLEKTFEVSRDLGFDYFTTTLTISPHKKSKEIFSIAENISGGFLAADFKKEDGFKKTMDLARRHSIYRQNYCGCIYSTGQRVQGGGHSK